VEASCTRCPARTIWRKPPRERGNACRQMWPSAGGTAGACIAGCKRASTSGRRWDHRLGLEHRRRQCHHWSSASKRRLLYSPLKAHAMISWRSHKRLQPRGREYRYAAQGRSSPYSDEGSV